MALTHKQCVPCHGGLKPLDALKARALLQQTPGWDLNADARKISRKFLFKNFADALAFVNRVGAVAEDEQHHPDILLGWGYCNITIQTHAISGLHENDFILAAKINALTE